MSVYVASPQSLLEASDSRNSPPVTTSLGTKEDYTSLQMSSAEASYSETAESPRRPSSVDLLLQKSPDSSTSPKAQLPASAEDPARQEESQGKRQKVRTVFSQMQLCILKDRFQKQKYLSLQQMQELSEVLNLSYKQVKTWFQNQRMKCKRWQKTTNWSKNNHGVTQVSAPTEYLDVCASYHQGCLPSGSLPMWSNQSWNSQAWNNQSWNSQAWNNQSWNSQLWCTQAWSNQAWNSPAWNNTFQNCGEDFLLPPVQQASLCDLEAVQTLDFFLNESVSIQSEDCMKTDI
ncbi:homeobox protein NANOG-like [Tenrec ecaudatus]|uniref:homeobox protein NANOG-like n=1 Tax=Tenrec ecaudatus TaxID=94439 RepID=UPI003F5A2BC3